MNIIEYKKVEKMGYIEYVGYLQDKYGIPKKDYMTKGFNKNQGISRTKEGLFIHHVREDKAIMLSNPEFAKNNPYEYQLAKNLVYCDYLEHLFLHILICEDKYIFLDRDNENEAVGVGGVINFIVPELNDIYSGFISKQEWKNNCANKIKNDKNLYLILVKRFALNCKDYPFYEEGFYKASFNDPFLIGWNIKNDEEIFKEIENTIKGNQEVWSPTKQAYIKD